MSHTYKYVTKLKHEKIKLNIPAVKFHIIKTHLKQVRLWPRLVRLTAESVKDRAMQQPWTIWYYWFWHMYQSIGTPCTGEKAVSSERK